MCVHMMARILSTLIVVMVVDVVLLLLMMEVVVAGVYSNEERVLTEKQVVVRHVTFTVSWHPRHGIAVDVGRTLPNVMMLPIE